MHAIRCMAVCVSVTKCPVAFLVSGKKYGQVKVIEETNTNPSPNLKDNPKTNASPKVTNTWFTLRLSRTFHDVCQN